MKNVLVLLNEDEGQEARLQVALDLTRALSGHLNCLDVALAPAFAGDYFADFGIGTVIEWSLERESANRAQIEARLRTEDVAWSVRDAIGSPADLLKQASELADIVVLNTRSENEPLDARQLVGAMAVESGRPVLAVPPDCRGMDLSGPVLVGWNSSREIKNALHAAVPLLRAAASVTLLDVNDPWPGEFSTNEAAGYLSRHGIHAEIVEVTSRDPEPEAILQAARELGARYIVLGAYGIPRAVEAMFGGVTDRMLRTSDLPLLLAH